jgi:hypothetical protein
MYVFAELAIQLLGTLLVAAWLSHPAHRAHAARAALARGGARHHPLVRASEHHADIRLL